MESRSEDAVLKFARDVVSHAFDQAVDVATRNAQHALRGIPPDATHGGNVDRDIAIAIAAAESAIASLFSNFELTGVAKVFVEVDGGTLSELEDLAGAPISSFFFKDGWLGRFSKYSSYVMRWQND